MGETRTTALCCNTNKCISFLFSYFCRTGGGSMLGDVNISAILDSFSVSYDKRVRPNYGGPPVEVGVTMYVLSISSLSEVKMVLP
ncbi:GBRB protein [Vespula maculifrons]|uniref:GBRB protein n=1 Tax=Vespula maculifrons TaxID=7453 RepID=A0ABD2D152_VESMC